MCLLFLFHAAKLLFKMFLYFGLKKKASLNAIWRSITKDQIPKWNLLRDLHCILLHKDVSLCTVE